MHFDYWYVFVGYTQQSEMDMSYYPIYPTPPLGQDVTQGQF